MTSAGYSIDERIFERSEMAVTISALDHANPTRTRAGARHVLSVPNELRAGLRSAAREHRAPVRGRSRCTLWATLFDKSKTSNWRVAWHQDTALPVRNRVGV